MGNSATPVVELSGVTKSNGHSGLLLDHVDMRVGSGESVAVLGRSGSGKTTLLSCLGLLDQFETGEFKLYGQRVDRLRAGATDRLRATSVGFVFQRFFLLSHLTALQNVEASWLHGPSVSSRVRKQRAMEALDAVGMASLARRKPRQLSGGEQQRVAIARAITRSPGLLLADEPTGSLDETTGWEIVELLLRLVKDLNSALVVVTHDRSLASRLSATLELSNRRLTMHRDSMEAP